MGEISVNLSRLLHNEANTGKSDTPWPFALEFLLNHGFSLILCLSYTDVFLIGKYVCCCNSYTCKINTTECSSSIILFTNVI